MTRYNELLNKLNKYDDVLVESAPIKEQVLVSYIQKVKKDLEEILSSTKDELLLEHQLIQYLKAWDVPRMYTAYPNSDVVEVLCVLAATLCEQHNSRLKENELPKTALEFLMPNLNLESKHSDYLNLEAFVRPLWDEVQEQELNELKEQIASSGLSMYEEEIQLTQEEKYCFGDYVSWSDRLSFYQAKNSGEYTKRIEQLKAQLDELKINKSFLTASKKQEQINRIGRVSTLNARKESYLTVAHGLSLKQVKLEGNYVLPALSLTQLLKSHILSTPGDSFIPISVLLKASSLRPYRDEFKALSLTDMEDETSRLQQHSPETVAWYEAQRHLDAIRSDKSHLLGHLTELCKHLRMYDAKEGVVYQIY